MKFNERCLEIWGDRAIFTNPQNKVNPTSYPVPTPSAIRGVLNCIYNKPIEFYYQINKIEVLKPIKYESIMTNCISDYTKDLKVLDVDKVRTQTITSYLTDVRYRVYFEIIMRTDTPLDEHVNINGILSQFDRRVESGSFFRAPYLGRRECMCFYSLPDFNNKPIEESGNCGIMLYDVFDYTKYNADNKYQTSRSWYNAVMENGVINVPPITSMEVVKECL